MIADAGLMNNVSKMQFQFVWLLMLLYVVQINKSDWYIVEMKVEFW